MERIKLITTPACLDYLTTEKIILILPQNIILLRLLILIKNNCVRTYNPANKRRLKIPQSHIFTICQEGVYKILNKTQTYLVRNMQRTVWPRRVLT